jgi:hypothetical protein
MGVIFRANAFFLPLLFYSFVFILDPHALFFFVLFYFLLILFYFLVIFF